MDSNHKAAHNFLGSGLAFLLVTSAAIYVLSQDIPTSFDDVLKKDGLATARVEPKEKPLPLPVVQDTAPPSPKKRTQLPAAPEPNLPAAKNSASAPVPIATEELLEDAITMVDSGDWRQAEAQLLAVLKSDPQNQEALIELSMIYLLDQRDPSRAMPFIKTAIEGRPENDALISELVAAADMEGSVEEITQFLGDLRREQPGSSAVAMGLGRSLMKLGRAEEATSHLQQAAEGREGWERIDTLETLGDAYSQSGKASEASEAWGEVLRQYEQERENNPDEESYLTEKILETGLQRIASLVESGQRDLAKEEIERMKEANQAPREWAESAQSLLRSGGF